jgi:hypothetical protein
MNQVFQRPVLNLASNQPHHESGGESAQPAVRYD